MISKRKKILIIGASGFIGNRLYTKLSQMSEYEVVGTYYKKTSDNLIKLNINATKSVESILLKIKPEIIIWSAGLKNLSITEKSKSKSMKYNYYSVKNVNPYIESNPATHFIFFSTDYVFKGDQGNYIPSQNPNPITHYGTSKWEAEKFIKNHFPFYSIIRTSAVIGKGSAFFDWIYESILENKKLELFTNIFSPTPIALLEDEVENLLNKKKSGTYHICGNEIVSRYDLGLLIAKCCGSKTNSILKADNSSISYFHKNLSLIPSKEVKQKRSLKEFIINELKEYENN